MPNPNTILVMNMEMKDCDQALHDQQFLSKVARSQVIGVIIIDSRQGVNHRVSSPYHLWSWWMPDVTVMDKQVVVIEHDNWVQVEEVIKEKNLVTLPLGWGGLNLSSLSNV